MWGTSHPCTFEKTLPPKPSEASASAASEAKEGLESSEELEASAGTGSDVVQGFRV